ncbi:uncharacterized protein [Ciconia boyciana]|uniref:uncharacterized protein isoform X3 n=1 Tax=Ciconia boyciana TaxID=52775 RepID=UPI003BA0E524
MSSERKKQNVSRHHFAVVALSSARKVQDGRKGSVVVCKSTRPYEKPSRSKKRRGQNGTNGRRFRVFSRLSQEALAAFFLDRASKTCSSSSREGRSRCGGSVSVDSDDGPALSCSLTGLSPCSSAGRKR